MGSHFKLAVSRNEKNTAVLWRLSQFRKGLSQASSYLISFAIRLLFLPLKRVAEGTLLGPRKLADWSELFVILSCLPQWLTAARG